MESTTTLKIRQHNAITSARYDYTACQLDILFYLISKLKKEDHPDTQYNIYVKDIETMTGRQWNYQQLREATADMGSRMFEIENEQLYRQLWMFQRVDYVKGQGCIEIQLSKPIRPYLFELKDNFTSYELHSALKLSSKYAKRIYQIASQWKDIGESKAYDISQFKEMLKLKDPEGREPEQFGKISQLKERVLDIAVRQINEHTDLQIDYRLVKKGRAFEKIRFYIKPQVPRQLPLAFDVPVDEVRLQNAKQILTEVGIKDMKLMEQILAKAEYVDSVFKFNYELKTGRVKAKQNAGGLLLKVLGLR